MIGNDFSDHVSSSVAPLSPCTKEKFRMMLHPMLVVGLLFIRVKIVVIVISNVASLNVTTSKFIFFVCRRNSLKS